MLMWSMWYNTLRRNIADNRKVGAILAETVRFYVSLFRERKMASKTRNYVNGDGEVNGGNKF